MNFTETLQNITKKSLSDCSNQELYLALLEIVRQKSADRIQPVTGRKLYYISAEFLIGKLLSNNLINLGLYEEARDALAAAGKNLSDIEEVEPEPSLGNGGLGRLAACFLDSLATLNLPGDGVGLGGVRFRGGIRLRCGGLRLRRLRLRFVRFSGLLAAVFLVGGGVGGVLNQLLPSGLVGGGVPLEQGDLHHRKDRKARRQRQRDPGPAGGGPALPGSFSRPDGCHHTVGKPFRTGVSSIVGKAARMAWMSST